MNEMKDWLQIIASLATALGFIALVFQLRINNKQMKIDSHQFLINSDRDLWRIALENDDLAPLLMASRWSSLDDVNPKEQLFAALMIDHLEHVFLRYQNGLIPKDIWPAIDSYIVANLQADPVSRIWEKNKQYYWPEFVAKYSIELA